MSTSRVVHNGPVTRAILQRGLLVGAPFVLADVGVSGGISQHWRQFEPCFRAFGFDPLVRECERLNSEEKNPGVKYFGYFVGAEGYDALFPTSGLNDPIRGWSNQPFERTSAARAQRQKSMSMAQWFNNDNPDVVMAKQKTSLDTFFLSVPEATVDFIKVDTDGQDYEVLCGARRLIDSHQVLGLLVETQFHGVSHPHANLFANIDRLLREHGFSLFDLDIYRYTRGILPGHFLYSIPAQTLEGQVLAGDALYLRDLGAPGYEQRWQPKLPTEKVLKLACLFEIFGMPDCAAEALLVRKEDIAPLIDVDGLLDDLAKQIHPNVASFRNIDERFQQKPEFFYPHSPREVLRRSLPRPVKQLLGALKRRLLN